MADPTYAQYHAIVKDMITQQLLEELRALVMVPEDLLLGTILARISQLEEDAKS